MGIFDRIAGAFERNNPQAVYHAELTKLHKQIAEVTSTAASLRAQHQQLDERGDPQADELRVAADEALRILAELKLSRAALDEERVRAPAQQVLAEARVAIAEANSPLGTTDEALGLNSVRHKVAALNRAASPGELDADGTPIHARREALGRKAAEQSARDQLAAMKAALSKSDD